MSGEDCGPPPPWWRPQDPRRAELDVWVVPGGSRSAITGVRDGRLRLAVAAAPEGGKANRAVQRLLADVAGLPVRQVVLSRGERSRAKTLLIDADDLDATLRRLRRAAGG